MGRQTVILRGDAQRALAKRIIDAAPPDAVVTIKGPTRTPDQNALLWALLGDISRSKPQGRKHTSEMWKALMMKACGHEVQFILGIDDEPFPVGFRSSNMSVPQMNDLITFIYQYGDRHGVQWSEPKERKAS